MVFVFFSLYPHSQNLTKFVSGLALVPNDFFTITTCAFLSVNIWLYIFCKMQNHITTKPLNLGITPTSHNFLAEMSLIHAWSASGWYLYPLENIIIKLQWSSGLETCNCIKKSAKTPVLSTNWPYPTDCRGLQSHLFVV